jgi:hypothetical protein
MRGLENTHDNGAGSMSALVLGEVVAAGKLLAAIGALKGLLMSVERAVVALEMFLAAEAARAESADEGLGRILSQRLLAATAGDGLIEGWGIAIIRAGGNCIVVGSGSLRGAVVVLAGRFLLDRIVLGLGLLALRRPPGLLGLGESHLRRLHDVLGEFRIVGRQETGGDEIVVKVLEMVGSLAVLLANVREVDELALNALALVAEVMCVLSSDVRQRSVVLGVKFEQRLEGRETVADSEEFLGSGNLEVKLAPEHQLTRLVVAGAKSGKLREFSRRLIFDSQAARIAARVGFSGRRMLLLRLDLLLRLRSWSWRI